VRGVLADFLPYGSLIPREDVKASNSIFKTLATKTQKVQTCSQRRRDAPGWLLLVLPAHSPHTPHAPQKDALNAIRKKLMNVISQEGLTLQSKSSVLILLLTLSRTHVQRVVLIPHTLQSSAVTPARLLALLRPFQTDVGAFYRHAGLMQVPVPANAVLLTVVECPTDDIPIFLS
jgi:hypothetical protein